MPEYIGGLSRVLNVDKVLNNNGDGVTPLGDFAGIGSFFERSERDITCHCDEHGYIIGLLCISPVPTYTQLLPKHFIKFDPLDYYNPMFKHIGYQPVTYKEAFPIEKYSSDGVNGLNETFGYQRAWYDYLGSTDEQHGLFRSNLRNYVISRLFGSAPYLSPAFQTLDSSDVNNVFADSADTDKFLGMVYFDMVVKRIIPRYGIPKLE